MASSNPTLIPIFYKWIYNIRPKRVLDVGCGFGKFGFICRDILEICTGQRYKKSEWKTKVDALEIFEPFVRTPMHEYLYDNIIVGDARTHYYDDYDLIIMGDVLEHMEKDEALNLVRIVRNHCRWLIIQTPYGLMKAPSCFDNPNEEHKCGILPENFNEYYGQVEINDNIFCILIRGEL